jgi:hypothetical protein
VEGRPEEFFLIVEMPEKRVFTHIGKAGYFTSGRAVIPLARKQLACRLDNLVRPN